MAYHGHAGGAGTVTDEAELLAHMTTSAFLTVSPTVEGSMAPEIAKAVDALEDYDVEYETTAMGTILEADSAAEIFSAAQAAHEAVDSERVGTFLKIDDKRTVEQPAGRKVEKVEQELGREARSRGE
jgi:uncharacterized protein YqgV (UPF0045/DUF77 family)